MLDAIGPAVGRDALEKRRAVRALLDARGLGEQIVIGTDAGPGEYGEDH